MAVGDGYVIDISSPRPEGKARPPAIVKEVEAPDDGCEDSKGAPVDGVEEGGEVHLGADNPVVMPTLGRWHRLVGSLHIVLLVVALAVGAALLGFITWLVTSSFYHDSVSHLAGSLRIQVLNNGGDGARRHMAEAYASSRSLGRGLAQSTSDQLALADLTVQSMSFMLFSSIPDVARVGFVSSDGNFTAYSKGNDGRVIQETNDFSSPMSWRTVPVNTTTGRPMPPVVQVPEDEDVSLLLLRAMGQRLTFWQALPSRMHGPLLAASTPLHTTSGMQVGISTVQIGANELEGQLTSTVDSLSYKGVLLYLTTEEGYLLATSDRSNRLNEASSGGALMGLLSASNSGNALIADSAQYLADQSAWCTGDGHHATHVKLAGSNYYVDTIPVIEDGLTLCEVLLVPQGSIWASLNRQNAHVWIVLGVIVGIVLIGGLLWGAYGFPTYRKAIGSEHSLQEALRREVERRRRADLSSQHKSQFMANMSHELRTPMAGIIGLVDILLCDEGLTAEQYDALAQLKRCSLSLLGLLNNILDLSKIEAGKLAVEKHDFSLRMEVESVVDMFAVQGLSSGVELALSLEDDVPDIVRGDSARFRQILANLMSNSIKFTKSGWVMVRGKVKTSDIGLKKGRSHWRNHQVVALEFEVEDTGLGIPQSKWESVFESFVQADSSTTRTHGGTGLGLSIVRAFVEMMGGSIAVAPKPPPGGQGTLVRFHVVFELPPQEAGSLPGQHDGPSPVPLSLSKKLSQVPDLKGATVFLAVTGCGKMVAEHWVNGQGLQAEVVTEWWEVLSSLHELLANSGRPSPSRAQAASSFNLLEEPTFSFHTEEEPTSKGVPCRVYAILDISLFPRTEEDNQPDTTDLMCELATLQPLRDLGVTFAWLLTPNTSSGLRQALREAGVSFMVNKPVSTTKLRHLLLAMAGQDSALDIAPPSAKLKSQLELREQVMLAPGIRAREDTNDESPPLSRQPSLVPSRTASNASVLGELARIAAEASDDIRPQASGQHPNTVTPPSLPSLQRQRSAEQQLLTSQVTGESQSSSMERECAPVSTSLSPSETVGVAQSKEGVKTPSSRSPLGSPRSNARASGGGLASQPRDALAGMNILLAEDTPVLRRLAVMMLRKLGAEVRAVHDGQEVLEALATAGADTDATSRFDVILMDCQMPRLDGYAATQHIRDQEHTQGGHIAIVALTAHAMASDVERCMAVGMDAYLTKPIDSDKLVSTLDTLVRGPKLLEKAIHILSGPSKDEPAINS